MGDLTERGLELFSEMRGTERAAEMHDEIEAGGFGSAMWPLRSISCSEAPGPVDASTGSSNAW